MTTAPCDCQICRYHTRPYPADACPHPAHACHTLLYLCSQIGLDNLVGHDANPVYQRAVDPFTETDS